MTSLTVIIPTHNEENNISRVFSALEHTFESILDVQWHVLFVDDGSSDASMIRIRELATVQPNVRYLELSRNFGKEVATTAGLHHVDTDLAIIMDADLQHPPSVIPEFIAEWKKGADTVIGVRRSNDHETFLNKTGSAVFYHLMSVMSETELVRRETDFRLISRPIIDEFKKFTERGRLTRGLLNWLGFKRSYIYFDASTREDGQASYTFRKRLRLAITSFLSHSMFPLKFAGYLGALIMVCSGFMGVFILIERFILHDPWGFNFSGPAILAVINLFLAGMMMACLGLVALYIGNIHEEVMNRPLYVVREKKV